MFGHILRLEEDVPAKKAMAIYCNQQKGKRGRPKTTLPVVLWQESSKVLSKKPSLSFFNAMAKDRVQWREFSERVIERSFPVSTKEKPSAVKVACAKSKKALIYKKKVS